jgi:anti-sigma regulatory factor (Ser/Thr protein kinase)
MFATLPHDLNELYPAVAGSVPQARARITQFATEQGISGKDLDAVRTAVTEAVTNVVRHAYDDDDGAFHLTAAFTATELWVLVADDGCGYQVPSSRPGLGLGLGLIARYSDEYVITERAAGGTEVRMRFPTPPLAERKPPRL